MLDKKQPFPFRKKTPSSGGEGRVPPPHSEPTKETFPSTLFPAAIVQGQDNALRILEATYKRQEGQLSDDDVFRVCSRCHLNQDTTLKTLELLVESGHVHENILCQPSQDDIQEAKSAARQRLISDPLELLRSDIGNRPFLTREDDVRLARKIKMGEEARRRMYLESSSSPLLLSRLRDGDAAKEELILASFPYALRTARRYASRGAKIELVDLAQEALTGLLIATSKYDPSHGTRFLTYASWWIFQATQRAYQDKGRLIRIPNHLQEKLRRVKRARSKIESGGRNCTAEGCAEETGLSLHLIQTLFRIEKDVLSLDLAPSDDDGDTLGSFITNTSADSPMHAAILEERNSVLSRLLAELEERERQILVARFGLFGSRMQTLEEIGSEMGVTRERVRQLESKALDRLRVGGRLKQLASFMEGNHDE